MIAKPVIAFESDKNIGYRRGREILFNSQYGASKFFDCSMGKIGERIESGRPIIAPNDKLYFVDWLFFEEGDEGEGVPYEEDYITSKEIRDGNLSGYYRRKRLMEEYRK